MAFTYLLINHNTEFGAKLLDGTTEQSTRRQEVYAAFSSDFTLFQMLWDLSIQVGLIVNLLCELYGGKRERM